MNKKYSLVIAFLIIIAITTFAFLFYHSKNRIYSKYEICFEGQNFHTLLAIISLDEADYRAYCLTASKYYQELFRFKNQQLPEFYKLKTEDIVTETAVTEYQSSFAAFNRINTATKLYVENKSGCMQSKDFENCVCDNKVTVNDFVGFLSKAEKLRQVMIPAYSRGQLQNFEASDEKFGGYVVIDSLGYANASEFKKDVSKLSTGTTIPQLIGIDGEGGIVQRFSWRRIDNLRTLSQRFPDKTALCKQIGLDAKFLKNMGFNWTLSPVVDVTKDKSFWIYSRTPSDDYQQAQELADLYTECMQKKGVYVTLKHFPGHGAASEDSHFTVPVVQKSKAEWLPEDAVAFTDYKNKPAAIMMSHLLFPQIDVDVSSQSKVWMQDILRNELGYQGLVVTDDLNMLRPRDVNACTTLVVRAINNGADLAIFVDSSVCDENKMLSKLLNSNAIKIDVLKARVTRVMEFKKEHLCSL